MRMARIALHTFLVCSLVMGLIALVGCGGKSNDDSVGGAAEEQQNDSGGGAGGGGTTPTAPSVTTNIATNIKANSAELNGNLTSLGKAASVSVSFQWGTASGDYPNETPAQAMTSTGNSSFALTGLSPRTTHYFRAKAVGESTSYGAESSFTTTAAPLVTTKDITDNKVSSAQLNGNLTYLGKAANVSVSFQWGTASGDYPNETPAKTMTSTGSFNFLLTGLSSETTYYFRAKAVGEGTSYGKEVSFIPTPCPT
jgi:subtilisin